MSVAIVAGLAASLSFPSFVPAISFNDYPEWALQREASAGAIVRVRVESSGVLTACTLVSTVGDAKLANQICAIVLHKKLSAPTLKDGTPVVGFGETFLRMFLPDTAQGASIANMVASPDVELTVMGLADGKSQRIEVVLAIDEQGAVKDCRATLSTANPALVAVACSQASQLGNSVVKDQSGRAVPYVTTKTVLFKPAVAASTASH